MKVGKMSLFLRLGAMASVLLFGQQAFAIGTAAGTSIDNTVTVDYDVGGINQNDIQDSVSFVVDRRVDFTIAAMGGALVDVTPGETDSFFDFLLTNDSNSELDFSVVLTQLAGGPVRASTDDADMALVEYAVSADTVAGTDPDPVRGGAQFVDQLPADDSIRIRVFGDAALTMLNGQVAGVSLEAIGREPGSGAATALTEDPNTDAGIENVFADAGNDNSETDFDGWVVVTADLTVTKAYAVVAGDLGSGLPIPGATIEYTITVANGSATDAQDVSIQDVLDVTDLGANPIVLNIAAAPYLGSDVAIYNDGAQVVCDIETVGGDCDYTDPNLDVGAAGGIDVAGNTTLTIQYQVVIPDPDPTP